MYYDIVRGELNCSPEHHHGTDWIDSTGNICVLTARIYSGLKLNRVQIWQHNNSKQFLIHNMRLLKMGDLNILSECTNVHTEHIRYHTLPIKES